MTYEDFTKLIADIKADSDRTHALYKLGIDTINYDGHARIVSTLGKEAFGKDGWQWFEWFCFEKDFGARDDMTAHDADGNEICKDVKGLWELVNET